MSRRSYEAYRAGKVASRRKGSVVESETDAESVASYTTYQSNSSYLTQGGIPSPRLGASSNSHFPSQSPHQHYAQGLQLSPNSNHLGLSNSYPSVKSRTFSSSSSNLASPLSTPYLDIPKRSGATHEEREKERERRRKEREERAKQSTLIGEKYDSPLRRWLRWMSKSSMSGWSLPVGLLGVLVIKTAVGYGGFSGQDSPPRYGDFEAQRHWMEVTIHRPLSEWYTYAPDWWLLDYPPLTGYASWLCGRIGSALNPAHFALDTSWGHSPPSLVTVMRFSVLSFEAVFWWTAVGVWTVSEGRTGGRSWRSQMTGIMTILLQPSLMLIDNGHFQYNSVLLGLSLWTVVFLTRGQDIFACVAFSLALCFKQMGLYYAPAVGCYLLGKCLWLGGSEGLIHLAKLGITTVATFIILFLPWLRPFPSSLLHVLHRIFPFARGIFEDKVANFWCASNVVLKWRNWFSIAGMARLATLATLAALLPTVLILLWTSHATRPSTPQSKDTSQGSTPIVEQSPTPTPIPPTARLLLISLFTSSLSFFLFSFQVHEKSILLPLMPLTVMMAMRGGKEGKEGRGGDEEGVWQVGVLLNNVAVFSMWPLLVRDGQSLQYVLTTLLWNYVIGYTPWDVQSDLLRWAGYIVYALITLIHIPDVLPSLLPPPTRYPDLYIVLNTLLSFGVFSLSWLWGTKKLIEGAWALGGLRGLEELSERKSKAKKVE